MKVLIDGRALGDASRYRGIGAYLRSLLTHLARVPDLELSVLAADDTSAPAGVSVVSVARRLPGRLANREHEFRLKHEVRRVDHDIFHSPALDPLNRSRRPWVQTLHDVIPLTTNHPQYAADRRLWKKRAERFRRASAIIAVSRFSAAEAIRVLDLDPARVHVVHHGVAPMFRPPSTMSEAVPPYLLYVGEFGPNKGFSEAFAVIATLAEMGFPHELRLAGRVAPWVRQEVDALVASSARPERVRILNWVSSDDLVALYQGASALIVTSRAEGFGFPALEAMATGTPVVAFSNTAIPEVVGDGGVLVPDGDVGAMAEEVASLIDDASRRREQAIRGLARAAQFSWDESARQHTKIYRAVSQS